MVTWRDGVHIQGTSLWCDATRARDVCFVSTAHSVESARHGQLIATAETLAMLSRRDKRQQPISQLSVPYARPFTLGTTRIELLRSGHCIGGASMVVDVDGQRVLYAGMVDPRPGGLGGAADMRACDTLVIDATYGDRRFRFPPVDEVAAEVSGLVAEVTGAGGVAVLLVTSACKGLDVAARLGDHVTLSSHRMIHHAAQHLRATGVELPRIRRFSGKRAQSGRVLLWPANRRDALDSVELPIGSQIALLSGRALDADATAEVRADAAFAWSNCAGFDELLQYLESSGASRVFLTSRFAEPLAAALDSEQRSARPLGPPRQMSLF
jgi:hypothetical protein